MEQKIINSLETKQVSDLCVDCGMCCDGTLFERARANMPNDNELIKKFGLTPLIINDKPFFKLPCHHFEKCCTVYNNERPSICSEFMCNPLRKYEKGDISFVEVEKIINETLIIRSQIVNKYKKINLFKDLNFVEFRVKLKNLTKIELSQIQNEEPTIFLDLFLFHEKTKKIYLEQ